MTKFHCRISADKMSFIDEPEEGHLASCSIAYSPEVAERAARQFFWRKWRTPFGMVFFSSLIIVSAVLIAW